MNPTTTTSATTAPAPPNTAEKTVEKSGEEAIKEAAEHLGQRLEEGRRRIESLGSKARTILDEHPAACLLGAMALGYVVAQIARRERI